MTGPTRESTEHQHGPGSREVAGGEPEAVRVWLLGGFRVTVGPRSIGAKEWRLKKAASLIKLLALAPGHRLHREQAMELLWPGLEPEAAANNLHQVLHVARRTLEPAVAANTASSYLTLRGELLVLCAQGALWVDVEAFEGAAATAHRSSEPAAYRAALELYAGDLLPEDLYEEWTEEKRQQLRQLYQMLLLELAGLYEEREEYGAAIEALRRVVAKEPTQEEAHLGLMHLYALSGRYHEAILQYQRLRKALRKELDEGPSAASRRLYEEIRAGKFPAAPTSPAAGHPSEDILGSLPNNLPASLTSFVGREDALLEIKRLLSMTRLLTLSGAGGTGKTRLALEVARDLVGAYPEGVWLVELAPLSDPTLVPQAVAAALGVREQPGRSLIETLTDHLRTKEDLLLVVDNCEHLIEAVARLADALLKACSKLRVLATSRERLGVQGEAVWTVPPLSLPDMERASSIGSLMSTEAVRLFLDRARSRLPGFELSEENVGSVGRVCRKLEGIPLAIELACARMGALAVEQVAQRLEDSLKLLTGGARTVAPRHRTMRATLAWSHGLLSEPEKELFGRLSVFAGGWTLAAAEEVCSGEGIGPDGVLDLLGRLVDKSLVVAEASPGAEGELRYRMLEPVRQYGQERLQESGEAERVRERHAQYYLALAEEADAQEPEPEFGKPRPVAWLKRMETEHGNLRAALSWLLDKDVEPDARSAELGLRLAVALYWFWYTHDYQSEGRRYLERAVARRSNRTMTRLRARALIGAGWMALTQADYETSKALMEEGLVLCRELGDEEGIASGLTELGYVAVVGQRDDIPMPDVIEELGELKPQVKNRNTLARLLVLEGMIAASRGDLRHSATLHEEGLELFREMRDAQGIITCLDHLGFLALLKTDYEGAVSLLREALRLAWETGYNPQIQVCLYGLACVAASQEQPVRAARLWGAAMDGMQEAYGVHLTPIARSITNYEGRLAAARSQLDEKAWLEAWEEGKAMPLKRAVEYAFSEEVERYPATLVPGPEQPPADEPTQRLTSREREVALLVARGLTNRRIASELSISERTVENHVRRSLKKLGFSRRAQIAAWVAQR